MHTRDSAVIAPNMLRVTIELLPGGDDSRSKRLATVEIANINGSLSSANYQWSVQERTARGDLKAGTGTISEFCRGLGAVHLVADVLREWIRRA